MLRSVARVRIALALSVALGSIPRDAAAQEPTDDASTDAPDEAPAEAPPPPEREAKTSKNTATVTAAPASASKPSRGAKMKGRVGFGAVRTLSGTNGLYVAGYVANRVTLGLVGGVATFSHREPDDNGEFTRTRTVGRFGVGPEVFFYPVQGDRDQPVHADFGFGTRVTAYVGFLGRPPDERGQGLDIPVEIDVELPAKIALWIGRRVAITPEFGIVLRIVPGTREPDQNGDTDENPGRGIGSRLGTTDGPGIGFDIGDHAGFFMGLGLGFYFGKID